MGNRLIAVSMAAALLALQILPLPASAELYVRFIGGGVSGGKIDFVDGGRVPKEFCSGGFQALDAALAVFQLENCKGDFYSLPADLQTQNVLLIDDRKGSPALQEAVIRPLLIGKQELPGPLMVRWNLGGKVTPILLVAESQRRGLTEEKWQQVVTLAATSAPFDAPFVPRFAGAPAVPKTIPLTVPGKDSGGVYYPDDHPIRIHRGFHRTLEASTLGQLHQAVVAARGGFVATSLEQAQSLLISTGEAGPPGLKALNLKHGDLLKDLRAWRDKNRELRKAQAALVESNLLVRAARDATDAALADLKVLTSEEELKQANAERAVVSKRISERGAFIKEVAGFVEKATLPSVKSATEIAGMAKDVLQGKLISGFVDAIVTLMSADDLRQLAEIDARITQIEKTIDEKKQEAVTKRLSEKRTALEAATSRWLAALIAVRLANSPKEALADLANAERKAAGSGARFSTAAHFFDKTTAAAATLASSCSAYRSALAAGPVSQTPFYEKDIDDYRKQVERDGIRDSDAPDWERSAREWSSFLFKLDNWRRREIKACDSITDYLELAGYLAPIDAVLRNAYCSLEAGEKCSWSASDLEWLRQTRQPS